MKSSEIMSRYDKIYLIRIAHVGSGFFAYLQWTLNQCLYCERNNFLPVVNYDKSYENFFYDPERGEDVWDYYFEPVAGLAFADVQRMLADPVDPLSEDDIVVLPDEQIMQHISALSHRYGEETIDGVVAAIGIAYNFVLHARSGYPACGPAAFHRALGAEHWRQYPASATNCADALGLVDHWRYSHDPARREKCAQMFKDVRTGRAQPDADPAQLIVVA